MRIGAVSQSSMQRLAPLPPTNRQLQPSRACTGIRHTNTGCVCTVHMLSRELERRRNRHRQGWTFPSVSHRVHWCQKSALPSLFLSPTVTISACPPDSCKVIARARSERADETLGSHLYVVYRISCTVSHPLMPPRFVSSFGRRCTHGSEAKAGVPVNSGVFKSVLATMAMASHRGLMTVTLRRQRGNEWQVVLFNLTRTKPTLPLPNGVHP